VGLKVGVIGVGKLGTQHVRVLTRVPEVEQVSCFDVVPDRSALAARQFGAHACEHIDELLEDVDAVSVVVPTINHREVSLRALERGRHLFLEKPIAASVAEAGDIIDAARRSGSVLQVGHIERFNAAVEKAKPHVDSPSFIEVHRLAPFTIRGTDVSVVMDLMIHDLDLLTLFVGEKPVDIRAKGAGILTDGPDIVNARLEYADGCVANLTASRVSVEPMRKVRIFSASSYLSIDLYKRQIKHFRKGKAFDESVAKLRGMRHPLEGVNISLDDFVEIEEAKLDGEEPLFSELQSFCRTVVDGAEPAVTGEDGLRALEIATEIQRIVSSDGEPPK
jgi:predicted dehydrogenase